MPRRSVRSQLGLVMVLVLCRAAPAAGQDAPRADQPQAQPQADQPQGDQPQGDRVDPAPGTPPPAAPGEEKESALERKVRELREAGALPDRLPPSQRPDRYGFRGPRAALPWWSYPYYPWYGLPQTYYGYGNRDGQEYYPPPVEYTPRLGLHHTYLGAYQFGFRVPEDAEPLEYEPNLGRFVGIVGTAKADLADIVRAAEGDPDDDGSLALMRAGKYRDAGRRLAARLEAAGPEDDPRTLLLLSEVFLALDKPQHAELLLEQALASDAATEVLPADVAGHFPTRDEFEAKVQALGSDGDHPLLLAYLSLHTRKPQAGLDRLQALARERPKDASVQKLYRHYLARAFQE